ncbi:hypothetical protein ABL78_1213 [Leptomonas seymouri]|uniref:Uncharacterized protein n=1 Tax=Leptomonas seymouri TaxID=5684 RepID=A0A0N1PG08_LEPSE|nr:hypothetical protein ABL78_1213 [Leptomonas seymouri]|eukprot:KPI89720.1 hypothetical protein ABL78_1213 [Leptomonas seymouri]
MRVQRGVLTIGSSAFSLLEEMRAHRVVGLALLAYKNWDAYADEALAALDNFTQVHSSALYSALTGSRVSRCHRQGSVVR